MSDYFGHSEQLCLIYFNSMLTNLFANGHVRNLLARIANEFIIEAIVVLVRRLVKEFLRCIKKWADGLLIE